MTLNLLFTSRHATYMTGDFRLTYRDRPPVDDIFAQKIVPVIKAEWCALASFCGVAKTSTGIDVGDWIVEQARQAVMGEKFADFVGRLRGADRWLAPLDDKRITILITGFRGRKPFLVCLSNFQDIDGRLLGKTRPQLEKFELNNPKTATIRVFGDPDSVLEKERLSLRDILSKNHADDAMYGMGFLADVNKKAATRGTTISEACVVGRLLPTGEGHMRAFGIDPDLEYMPNFVRRQFAVGGVVDFKPKTDDQGQPLKPAWVQMGFKVLGAGKEARTLCINELRNVQGYVKGPIPLESDHETATWSKISERGGRETVTVLRPGEKPTGAGWKKV